MKLAISTKRIQVNKANTTVVIVIAVAAAITTFALVSSKALLDQRSFQSRVISKKSVALNQIKENVQASETLAVSYQAFVSSDANIIGGSSDGEGPRDGDNARIILDALPSKYDFPAVTTSLEKVLTDLNLVIGSISGTDDEIAQKSQNELIDPEPVEIPFEVSVDGSYSSVQNLLKNLQSSIRPVQVTQLSFSSSEDDISLDLGAKTYYQPEKLVDIRSEVVR